MGPAVFFLLLTLICGGDTSIELGKTNCTSVTSAPMVVGYCLAGLFLVGLVFFIPAWKFKRDEAKKLKTERDNAVTALQQQGEELEKQREEGKKLREELEKQRCRLREQLEENERERKENKQKLQSVEREITEREKMFDKPEELLRQKENLLQVQWKLDETKKMLEKQILDREKLLEPIEDLLRRNRQRDVIIFID